jgi:hypothetical protein
MSSDNYSRVIRGNIRPLGKAYLLLIVEIYMKELFLLFTGKLAFYINSS